MVRVSALLAFWCCRWHEPAFLGTLRGGVRKLRPPCALVVPIHHASMNACSHAFSSLANWRTARNAGSLGKAGSSQSLTLVRVRVGVGVRGGVRARATGRLTLTLARARPTLTQG